MGKGILNLTNVSRFFFHGRSSQSSPGFLKHRYINFFPLRVLDLEVVAKVNDPSRDVPKGGVLSDEEQLGWVGDFLLDPL